MGIARAIERVKRQARQGGLSAVMAGLGEELRSTQIPGPLRSTAQRIATLLEGGRSGAGARPKQAPTQGDAVPTPGNGQPVTVPSAGAASNTNAVPQPSEVADAAARRVDTVPLSGGAADAMTTGTDSGAVPTSEPAPSTPVDPVEVGATPEVVAGPLEVEPVDASPVDVAPTDASPIEIDPAKVAAPEADAHVGSSTENEASKAPRAQARKAASEAGTLSDGNPKEELARPGEAAKNLARSGSRGKKRGGSRGNTSKKK